MMAKIFHSENGTTCSFVSKKTTTEDQKNDHSVFGIGVGIAPAIPVVEVNIKGKFDQQVEKNSDVSNHETEAATARY